MPEPGSSPGLCGLFSAKRLRNEVYCTDCNLGYRRSSESIHTKCVQVIWLGVSFYLHFSVHQSRRQIKDRKRSLNRSILNHLLFDVHHLVNHVLRCLSFHYVNCLEADTTDCWGNGYFLYCWKRKPHLSQHPMQLQQDLFLLGNYIFTVLFNTNYPLITRLKLVT